MTPDSVEVPRRLLGAVHLSVGATLLVRPGAVSRMLGGRTPPHRWVIRLLGARSLVQGAVTVAVPDTPIVVAGAVVDGMHALTMVIAAAVSGSQRRAAVVSAAVAAGCCAAGAAAVNVPRVPVAGVRSDSGA
jgi:hypothetical protein